MTFSFYKIIAFLSLPALFIMGCARPKFAPAAAIVDAEQKEHNTCADKFLISGYCANLQWEKMPTSVKDYGSFIFKIYRLNKGDGSALLLDPEGSVGVQLWMPSMGHGSSPVTVEQLDIGTYRASQVLFVMPGKWQILFQIKNAKGEMDQATHDLTF